MCLRGIRRALALEHVIYYCCSRVISLSLSFSTRVCICTYARARARVCARVYADARAIVLVRGVVCVCIRMNLFDINDSIVSAMNKEHTGAVGTRRYVLFKSKLEKEKEKEKKKGVGNMRGKNKDKNRKVGRLSRAIVSNRKATHDVGGSGGGKTAAAYTVNIHCMCRVCVITRAATLHAIRLCPQRVAC